MKKLLILLVLIISITGLIFVLNNHQEPVKILDRNSLPQTNPIENHKSSTQNIPDYVYQTLAYVSQYGKPPENFVGGRNFQNRERRLKQKDEQGNRIDYREWDVYPKRKGQSRGAERLITGSDNSAYYTSDHYKSFIQIK